MLTLMMRSETNLVSIRSQLENQEYKMRYGKYSGVKTLMMTHLLSKYLSPKFMESHL